MDKAAAKLISRIIMNNKNSKTINNKAARLIIIISFLFCGNLFAQHKPALKSKTQYKLYTNNKYHFSFEIPSGWKITASGDGMDYDCMAISKIEKEVYQYYDGYVFGLQVGRMNLDSALNGLINKGSDGEYYYNPPFEDTKKVDKVNGPGFTGLKEIHSCRADLKSKDGHTDSTVVDGCEQIYLSNGKITLTIITNGIELDDDDYDRLIKTLHFF